MIVLFLATNALNFPINFVLHELDHCKHFNSFYVDSVTAHILVYPSVGKIKLALPEFCLLWMNHYTDKRSIGRNYN